MNKRSTLLDYLCNVLKKLLNSIAENKDDVLDDKEIVVYENIIGE